MRNILDAIYAESWAITESALMAIIKIAARVEDLEPEAIRSVMHGKGTEALPEALLGKGGKPLTERGATMVRDGTAIIPVIGPIFPRANMMTAMSGATSAQQVAMEFTAAMESPDVHSIVLNIDSPGGAVTGINELSQMIYNARGQKPIKAYVSGIGASAAYWLASAADEVISAETAELGSIGVVSAYKDTSTKDDREGVKTIEVVSSISPLKRVNPSSDEGRAKVQRIVDSVASVFVKALAQNRGTEESTVLEDFGKGDLFVGARALSAGLIDRVGTMEQVMAECGTTKNKSKRKEHMMADETTVTITAEGLRESDPATFAQIVEIGAAAERKRIQDIESINVPGCEAIVTANKFNPDMTRDKIAGLILEDQENRRKKASEAAAADAARLAEQSAGLHGTPAPIGQEAEAEERNSVAGMIAKGMDAKRGSKVQIPKKW
jgi:signal peptide peptidase SppA